MIHLRISAAVVLGLILTIAPQPAQAYLDPGAGSVLLQLLLGGVAGLIVALRVGWRNILAMFGIGTEPPSEDAQSPESDD